MHSFCDLQSFGKELPEFLLCDSEKAFRPLQCRETGRCERSCADYVVNMYICIYICNYKYSYTLLLFRILCCNIQISLNDFTPFDGGLKIRIDPRSAVVQARQGMLVLSTGFRVSATVQGNSLGFES